MALVYLELCARWESRVQLLQRCRCHGEAALNSWLIAEVLAGTGVEISIGKENAGCLEVDVIPPGFTRGIADIAGLAMRFGVHGSVTCRLRSWVCQTRQ